jgi:all-trans-retinol 13,14-reductase
VHALILNSYIESSWKCVDGGSQIARIMAKNIRANGGIVQQNSEVKRIVTENEAVSFVELADGSRVYAKNFISNIHPAKTMELTETAVIKNAYRNRLKNLSNTVSSFMLNIVLKKNTVPYRRYNYYYHREGHIWDMTDYTETNWPLGYALYFSPSAGSAYAEAITVLTYMRYEEVKDWERSFNTASAKSIRGEAYEAFKKNKAEKLLDCVSEKFPGLRDCIESYATATPLSYRDYLGSYDGSLYGIAKDYKDPVKTLIAPRTKLANLYLTGQNLNLHGILGTAISGLITCSTLMGKDDFIEKIRNA